MNETTSGALVLDSTRSQSSQPTAVPIMGMDHVDLSRQTTNPGYHLQILQLGDSAYVDDIDWTIRVRAAIQSDVHWVPWFRDDRHSVVRGKSSRLAYGNSARGLLC